MFYKNLEVWAKLSGDGGCCLPQLAQISSLKDSTLAASHSLLPPILPVQPSLCLLLPCVYFSWAKERQSIYFT